MKLVDLIKLVAGASKTAPRYQWVCVKADRHARYREFLTVMDRLHLAGYRLICVIDEQ